ncbi:molecular chaperone DnaK [endosymbiont GvMRE of Glomus versiforme]|uniref:molecular chaperone DnaK n=1 Tax=endosymbiont GvMRE of Glomus versiforme TaxID=2039283 RepID=UPI000ED03174|nr:molecular chaperone DnaK [endosymbiont GvMRE of Glomus versiforme]RHZ35395.1 Chaperone protein DnaK [endosymbiont GvMRE of Glomus versiforme]
MNEKIIGIDLGTTNSCTAIFEKEQPRVLENSEGFRTTPSVVCYDKGEKRILVGNLAKRQIEINPETISSIKREMGKKVEKNLNGKGYSPENISAKILRYLVDCAENTLGEKITRVVITVPAYFDDNQRQATIDAGTIAGLNVERIIDEPTAAALAYGLDKTVEEVEQNVLVYDLGGGTFDVSILQISKAAEGNVFKAISTAGINTLGGDNFDKKIVEYVVEEVKKNRGINLLNEGETTEERRIIKQRLKEVSEGAKKDLSQNLKTKILLPYIIPAKGGESPHVEVELTRSTFVELISNYIKETMKEVDEAIKRAKEKSVERIDQVILVGGSTRIPAIEKEIEKKFGKAKINKSVNPDEVVAIGAAVQGAILSGGFDKKVVLVNVTSLSLGIEIQGGRMDPVIPRNQSIPTKVTKTYSTAEDNQKSVSIRIFQGERPKAEDNKLLGYFELSNIEPAPKGIPQIEVTFDIDVNGIVSVFAKDKKTGKQEKLTIKDSQNLSSEEIQRMIKEAEENKEKDEEDKANWEIYDKAQSFCYGFEKQIKDFKEHKNFNEGDEGFKKFEEMYKELKEAVNAEEKNYQDIKSKLNKVEEMINIANELERKMGKEEKKDDEGYASGGNEEEVLDVEPEDKDKK